MSISQTVKKVVLQHMIQLSYSLQTHGTLPSSMYI